MLFYDYEVFRHDWLVVICDTDTKQEHVIINDLDALQAFHDAHKKDIWVGFNNRHYDQWIHKSILCGFNPWEMNRWIIEQNKQPYKFSKLLNRIVMTNYDVMKKTDRGLKTFEGFMGHDIQESSVPFTIRRKLRPDEIEETVRYCRHDVHETMEIFMERINDFNAHMDLVKLASGDRLQMDLISKTGGQLSAHLLDARKPPQPRTDEFDIVLPDTLRIEKYTHVPEWYLQQENKRYYIQHEKKKPTKNGLDTIVAGIPHRFAWGGVHGAIKQSHYKGHLLLVDAGSMYPSVILEYGLLSRNCPESAYDVYQKIYDERLQLKKEGKKKEQAPLKLFLNRTYGIMKDKYNPMYDHLMANMVCVYGQLFILDLIEKLEPHCEIIQSNTDGILVKMRHPDDFDLLDDICHEWEERTGLNLDFEEYKEIYQKDVNNYVLIDHNGKYKSIGSYVKKLDKLDNDLSIVNKALVDYMVRGIPVEKTVNDATDLMDFQMVTKVSYLYECFLHGGEELKERTLRVFASLDPEDGDLKKKHAKKDKGDKVSNSPLHCFIENRNIEGVKAPEKLDRNFYVELTKRRLEQFGVR